MPVERHGVGADRPDAPGLQQRHGGCGEIGCRHDERKRVEPVLVELHSQLRLRLHSTRSHDRRPAVAFNQLHRRDQPGPTADPGRETQHTGPACRRVGKEQDLRLPVDRAFGLRGQLLQPVLDLAVPESAPAVAPPGRHRRPPKILVSGKQQRHGDSSRRRIDRQHDPAAQECAEQTGACVVEPKAWPERRTRAGRLHIGRIVEQSVRDEEEHRNHRGDGVQIADDDRDNSDQSGQHHRATRVPGRGINNGERAQPLEQPVARQRLQDPRRPEERGERRRQGGRQHPGPDEPRYGGHAPHRLVVARQIVERQGRGEHDDGRAIHHGRHAHRQERSVRQAAGCVLQVARHADALCKAGHRRKEDGEQHPEGAVRGVRIREQTGPQHLGVPGRVGAHEE